MTTILTHLVVQQQTVTAFLTARAYQRYARDQHWRGIVRYTGISSDALAEYGVRGRGKPTLNEYPADRSDLDACERTYLLAPDAVRNRMLPVLNRYRAYVAENAA